MLHYPERHIRRKHNIRILVALFIFLYSSLLALTGCGGAATGSSANAGSGVYAGSSGASNTVAMNDPSGINDPSSINNAVAAAAQTNGTVTISSAMTLGASLTIPSNVAVVFEKGGSIVKASNYTLKIDGPFSAGLYQVFSGFNPGDVTFGPGSVEQVLPQWWGADPTGVNDSAAAINAAIDSLITYQYNIINGQYVPGGSGIVYIPTGKYKILSSITGVYGVNLMGAGMEAFNNAGTIIKPVGGITALDFSKQIGGFTVEDMTIDGGAIQSGSTGVLVGGSGNNFSAKISFNNVSFSNLDYAVNLQSCWWINFNNCNVKFNNIGVYSNLTSGGYIQNISFMNTRIAQNTNYGVYLPGGQNGINQFDFENCVVELNGITEMNIKDVGLLNITSSWFERSTASTAIQISNSGPGVFVGNMFNGPYVNAITDGGKGNARYISIENNKFASGITNAVAFSASCDHVTLSGNYYGGANTILQGPYSSIQP
ncbi:MAG: glycosyl hydrolase family 28-related protein [Nitrospiraceae bacterium]|nr:glycosyl hydrolase family 28-related protein [Nitrospiraceae bacterium]